jgi:serine/threonine protein kinase
MEEFEMNNSPKKLQQSLEDLEKKLKTMQCNCSNTNLQFCEQCFDVLLEDSDRLENLKKSFFDLTGRIYKVKGVFGNGVLNKYNFGRMIGRGGYGSVYEGENKVTGEKVALKHVKNSIITWSHDNGKVTPEEIIMMKKSQGPGTIKLIEMFEQDDSCIYVMEKPDNSMDMYTFIYRNGALKEKLAAKIFKEIVRVVVQSMLRGVLHQDLKNENILVNTTNFEVQLIDFGLAEEYTKDQKYKFRGLDIFAPPEWWLNRYILGVPSTSWALGIILYQMVSGYLPFTNKEESVFNRLRFITEVSPDCKLLIGKLMKKREKLRLPCANILDDPWFQMMESRETM